jgi:hypothetical protein
MVIRSAYDIQLEFNLLPGYRKTPWLHLNGNTTHFTCDDLFQYRRRLLARAVGQEPSVQCVVYLGNQRPYSDFILSLGVFGGLN